MNFAAFFSYAFLTLFTPGPNTIMSMRNAGEYGLKKAFPFNLGILTGFFNVLLCRIFLFFISCYPFCKAGNVMFWSRIYALARMDGVAGKAP